MTGVILHQWTEHHCLITKKIILFRQNRASEVYLIACVFAHMNSEQSTQINYQYCAIKKTSIKIFGHNNHYTRRWANIKNTSWHILLSSLHYTLDYLITTKTGINFFWFLWKKKYSLRNLHLNQENKNSFCPDSLNPRKQLELKISYYEL